jgi:spore germination protein YaaH
MNYSIKYQNPYITYHNSDDNTDNIGWYEDTRSVDAKMDLARMFGVTGISFWRLGLIPTYGDTAERQIFYDIPAWLTGQK